jgi:hypothetical protein
LLFVGGCVSFTVPRYPSNAELRMRLVKQASFDMRCDEKDLKVTVLQRLEGTTTPNGEFLETSEGVEGCGQRVTYVLTGSGAWVANATTQANTKETP